MECSANYYPKISYIFTFSTIFLKRGNFHFFSYWQLYVLWYLLDYFQQINMFCSCMFVNSNDNCILHSAFWTSKKPRIILIQNKLFELLKKFKSLFFSSCWWVKINQSLIFDRKESSFLTIWFLYAGMTKERVFFNMALVYELLFRRVKVEMSRVH